MEILKDREILGLEGSRYLTDEAKSHIERLLRLAGECPGDAYQSVDDVVSSFEGWNHGSVMEAFIDALNPSATVQDCIESAVWGNGPVRVDPEAHKRSRMEKLGMFKQGYNLTGVYFAEEGFIGFAFEEKENEFGKPEKRSLMLLLPYDAFPDFCLGYIHPRTDYRFVKKFMEPGEVTCDILDMNESCAGPMGTEFLNRMDAGE